MVSDRRMIYCTMPYRALERAEGRAMDEANTGEHVPRERNATPWAWGVIFWPCRGPSLDALGASPKISAMNFAARALRSPRILGSLGASLLLAGCAVSAPEGPAIMTFPGKDKSAAAFEQDQSICQRHAVSHTGYGLPSEPVVQPSSGGAAATTGGAPAAPSPAPAAAPGKVSAPAEAEKPDELSFAQCMAARGDIVQLPPPLIYDDQYAYAFPGSIGYGIDYPYPYPYYGAGFIGGFGFFAFNGGYHHGYYHGTYYRGGYRGAGYHGGWAGHGGHGGVGHH
jgi:hypothetical protein